MTTYLRRRAVVVLLRSLILATVCNAFHPHGVTNSKSRSVRSQRTSTEGGGAGEEMYYVKAHDGLVDDPSLSPPPINIRKESILFGENPATMENNNALKLWKNLKGTLPFIFTGARRPDTGDDNPIGAIYNIVFVRLPVIAAGIIYVKNQIEGHPLVVDFGDGPMAMNPLVILFILFTILR